tara:strand:+ start:814 stop:1554 length:741 start_codon:yes stop_codon:yes gene_type:complete
MLRRTAELKNIISQGASIKELENFYHGEDCYILLTGPSLNDYEPDFLKEKLQDKLIFSVKQSFLKFKEISDFHFWNCSNFPLTGDRILPYKYDIFSRPIVVSSSNFLLGQRWDPKQKIDFFVKIPMLEDVGKENCLVFTKNYDQYLLNKTLKRAVGPGIMLETVLYFAVHFGVKNIYTLGWDLDAHGSHFYKEENVSNKGCEIPWDMEAAVASVPSIVDWLRSHNINLKTISKTSPISDKVERVTL